MYLSVGTHTHTHICVCTCMCNLVTVSDCDSIKFTSDLGVVVMGGLPWVHVVFYLEWAVVPFLGAETTLSFSSLSEKTSLQSPSSRTLSSGFYTQLQPKKRQLLTWILFTILNRWIQGTHTMSLPFPLFSRYLLSQISYIGFYLTISFFSLE